MICQKQEFFIRKIVTFHYWMERQSQSSVCRHRRGAQLESDYLVHRSVRYPVSHWICLEQAEMAFITT